VYEAWGLGRVGGMEVVGLAMASLSADMLQGLDLIRESGILGVFRCRDSWPAHGLRVVSVMEPTSIQKQ